MPRTFGTLAVASSSCCSASMSIFATRYRLPLRASNARVGACTRPNNNASSTSGAGV
jgi:hypothetical protein